MPVSVKPLPQTYEPKEAEPRWQQAWERGKVYAWDESLPRELTYVIDTPPPTVSGQLHMGHVFSYTQADFIARFQRMSGKTVFYPMGFDDNGLPTERLVEKVKKIQAHKFIQENGREAFVKLCDEVAEEARSAFRALFQSIALSVDWAQEYHTISDEVQKLSQLSFLDLYEKGQVYRALKPMLWDPVDQTAIAQAEIVDKDIGSFSCVIPFGIAAQGTDAQSIKWGEIEKVNIMTTRPELLGACVALMCHPDDAAKFAGKCAVTPLYGVVVPIIADEKVDKEKGTGLVMCCTYGDETDIQWQEKHGLPIRVVLNKYGKLDLNQPWLKPEKDRAYCEVVDSKWAALSGLKAEAARAKTAEILQELGCLIKQEPITHAVKCAERSGAPLEILPTYQWFVKVLDKKEALKEKAAACNWHPEWMKVRMDQWIDGLNWDWCISRQRYFGVPFPVWYSTKPGEEGKVIVAKPEQLPVNPLVDDPEGYGNETVQGEPDVMDTWATSSISPQLSSHAINRKYAVAYDRHEQLFPADLRPQAHEIIRTWAFYTLVKAHLHEDSVPWKNLMISGWCLAEDKTKMSKSKGNVVTPVELIEDQGADAVRYWASTSRLGADTAFSRDALKIGRKLVNKLWNATKFAAIHFDKVVTSSPESAQPIIGRSQGDSPIIASGNSGNDGAKSAAQDASSGFITEVLDVWVLSRLNQTIKKASEAFDAYEYADARAAVEDFFWNDFCDNYLELIKKRAYDEEKQNPTGQVSAAHTVYHCLNGLLKLFAPFVPHIAEELFSHLYPEEYARTGSLHARGMWPKAGDYPCDEMAIASGVAAVSVLNAIRKAKSERGVSIKYPIERVEIGAGSKAAGNAQQLLSPVMEDVKAAGNVAEMIWVSKAAGAQTEDGAFALALTFAAQAEVA